MNDDFEIFSSEREFRRKFPSKLYVCCWCGYMTTNPNICTRCNRQANLLFSNNTYCYSIAPDYKVKGVNKVCSIDEQPTPPIVKQIFKPIEISN